jgi:hypothetical protein
MILYAYVCVCAFSLHRESPGRILGDKPLLVQGGSVTLVTCRVPEDPASSVPAGDTWWLTRRSMSEGLV